MDEYFTITAEGKVTRTFKPGTVKYNDWTAPRNFTVQELSLTGNGVAVESTKAPRSTRTGQAHPRQPDQGAGGRPTGEMVEIR